MDNKKSSRKNSGDPQLKHLDMKTADAACATDFTGLIPANPKLHDAIEAYEDIHEFGENI